MLWLVVAIDKPASDQVVSRRSYLADIAGNSGHSVAHVRHFQSRHSFSAFKGKRRGEADLISIQMFWSHVWIVHRHSKKSALRKNILGLSPSDQGLERGNDPVRFKGVRNPNIGDLSFGQVQQSHWKSRSLFLRAHGEIIFVRRKEFFANLALFDLAAFSKLTRRSIVAGSEGSRKSGRR